MRNHVVVFGALCALAGGAVGCGLDDADLETVSEAATVDVGDYRLVRRGSLKCLDGGSGDRLQQWTCSDGPAQGFRVEAQGGDVFQLVHIASARCIDVASSGTSNGTRVQLWGCNGTGAQRFRIEDRGDGSWRLRNTNSNKCVEVAGGSSADGAAVQIRTCGSSTAQHWELARLGGGDRPAPPATWREHWFEHDQLLQLAGYNDDVAIYFDDDVDRASASWLLPYITDVWRYAKATYGDFGPDRLYSIHHQGRYGGGHPSTYFDDSHDFRNVSDCGPGPWGPGAVDMPTHEIAHVVEIASRGVHGSPAFGLWGDSKWAEFFQYDVYVALGRTADAARVFDRYTNTSDGFPRANTYWFRDWFYPLWRDHGRGQVMARFFQLLAQHFPRSGRDYARDMNLGEYVHFMSGAAGTNLRTRATTAFGWSAQTDAQFTQARSAFPQIAY